MAAPATGRLVVTGPLGSTVRVPTARRSPSRRVAPLTAVRPALGPQGDPCAAPIKLMELLLQGGQ